MGTGSADLPMVRRAIGFDVARAIMQGIPIAVTLRNFGQLWQTSPVDLDSLSQTKLWSKSQPVESFDVFFSHTWQTPGSRKFLSLLLQYGWRMAIANCAFFVALVFLLAASGTLPMTSLTWPVNVLGFKASCPFAPWTYITVTLTLHISLFLFPYCTCARYSPRCFLDVVSIHQTDKTMKQRGVYGLGGFLSVSKEMRVLWSPPYLTRSSIIGKGSSSVSRVKAWWTCMICSAFSSSTPGFFLQMSVSLAIQGISSTQL